MRRTFTLMLIFGGAATGGAQTPEMIAEVEARVVKERQAVDVEVLRRLLNRQFGFTDKTELQMAPPVPYMSTGTTVPLNYPHNQPLAGTFLRPLAGTLSPALQVSQPIGPFDGTLMPGGGVVFTLRIPAGSDLTLDPKTNAVGFGTSCGKCHTGVAPNGDDHRVSHKGAALEQACAKCHEGGAAKTAGEAPRSDWDRVWREVGVERLDERVKPARPPEPRSARSALCRPGDVAEQVIQVLASNAKNVGNTWPGNLSNKPLAKTDRVTVVVTFDELPRQASETLAPTGKPGFNADELQALNLGGLHLKQQKYREAAEAFEKGLARYQDAVIRLAPPAGTESEAYLRAMRESEAAIRGMFQQLALAYLQLGEPDKAKAALGQATGLKLELAAPKPAGHAVPRFPAKLIVSVTKADIDAAKSLEEFRKAVSVERTGFPEPKK